MSRFTACIAMMAAVAALTLAPQSALAVGSTDRVSRTSAGGQSDGGSWHPAISADGRYVAFASVAPNLAPGSTGGWQNVYVRDRSTGATECISVTPAGLPGDGWSGEPAISADGRYVAFASSATNLTGADVSGWAEIYLRDRVTDVTIRVSYGFALNQLADGDSALPAISADGRYVAYESLATNLIPTDTNGCSDIFMFDRQTVSTRRISFASGYEEANFGSYNASISGDGRYVAFQSDATNLVAGDTNMASDVFVHDTVTALTELISVSTARVQGTDWSGTPSISASGRCVAFASIASGLAPGMAADDHTLQAYVRDRQLASTERASVSSTGAIGTLDSAFPGISGDGRFVAFESLAPNLAPGDTNGWRDAFVHDRVSGITERISISTGGAQGDDDSFEPVMNADGRYVAFGSYATTLVADDTNACSDIFLRVRTKIGSGVSLFAVGGGIGTVTDLRAMLIGGGLGIPARKITFSVDGRVAGSAITAATGEARLPFGIPSTFTVGAHTVTAAFDGSADPEYNSSTRTGDVLLCRVATAVSPFAVLGVQGRTTTLRGLLIGGGARLAGKTLAFRVDGSAAGAGVTDATGVASCAYTVPAALAPGLHTLTVTYEAVGDPMYAASTRSADTLRIKRPTAITVSPAMGVPGYSTNLQATLLCAGTALPGKVVRFTVDSAAAGSATTDATGAATLPYVIPAALALGRHAVTAAFDGSADTVYDSCASTSQALLCRAGTTISLSPAAGAPGGSTTLRALLVAGSAPLSGKIVRFSVDAASVGSATTDASGTASLAYAIPASMTLGVHSVTGTFDAIGDTAYEDCTRTAPVFLCRSATSIKLVPADGVPGRTATLAATLTSGARAVPGKAVRFLVDQRTVGSATTDAAGTAALTYTIPVAMALGVHNVTALFEAIGDPQFEACSVTAAALVCKTATAISLGAASGVPGLPVNLVAVLVGGGAGLPGKTLRFGVDGKAAGTAVTDAAGKAVFAYTIPAGLALGWHTVTASFDGSADPAYDDSSRTGQMLLCRTGTAISIAASSGWPGQTVALRALLYSAGKPVASRVLKFQVDGVFAGTGTTDATGLAACPYTIPATMALGTHNVTAMFTAIGDPDLAPSSRTSPVLTVTKTSPTILVGSAAGSPGGVASLWARLSSGSTALPGRLLAFSVDGAAVGRASTDANGIARIAYTVPAAMATGTHRVTVLYDGSTDPTYGSMSVTATSLTVKLPTGLSIYAAAGAAGSTVTLRVILVSGQTPVPGKTVAFAVLGVPVGTGVTDATGVARVAYTIPAGTPSGTAAVTTAFDGTGDPVYFSSTRTSAVLTVQ